MVKKIVPPLRAEKDNLLTTICNLTVIDHRIFHVLKRLSFFGNLRWLVDSLAAVIHQSTATLHLHDEILKLSPH